MKIVVQLELPPEVIALVKKLTEDVQIELKTKKPKEE